MALTGAVEQIQLRRYDTSTQWGFRMQGGSEYSMPLYVSQVSRKSIADKSRLMPGDAILQICGDFTQYWTHTQAKQAMIRAGNEVDLIVQRGVVRIQPSVTDDNKHAHVDERSINPGMNMGSKFRNVTPRSYRMLEAQLANAEHDTLPSALEGKSSRTTPHTQVSLEAVKPTSIFDKRKPERACYLQAQGDTIQKAYGQKY